MSRLPITFQVLPDESLAGALFRASSDCGYLLSLQLAQRAGFMHTRIETIAGKDPAVAASAVADLLGDDVQNVFRHFHREHGNGICDWFGTHIRSKHREIVVRRVAPRSLRASPHLRAIWQLRVFNFDPRTLETLLFACPQCGATLDYIHAMGVSYCGKCRGEAYMAPKPLVDLRDFPQPVLEVSDREALDFVVDLIDPDPTVRARFAPDLHDDLRSLSRGELFEFTVALCCVADQDAQRSTTSIARPTSREDYFRVFSPDKLATAGRVLMQWPTGFDALCDNARSTMGEREGFFGIKAELGQVYALQFDRSLSGVTRTVARAAIGRNMVATDSTTTVRRSEFRTRTDLITSEAASLKYGIRRKLLTRLAHDERLEVHRTAAGKGPVMFRDDQIGEIAKVRNDLEAISSVSTRLGIAAPAVRQIASAGLIREETGPVVRLMVGKEYFRRSSVDALIDRIAAATKAHPGGNAYARLTKSMNALPPGDKPWASVIRAILEGRLEVFEIEGRLAATLIKLATRTQAEFVEVVKDDVVDAASPNRRITQGEAAEMLNTSTPMVISLAAFGAIPRSGLTFTHIQQCGKNYIFVPEISARMGTTPKLVRANLAARNIHPVFAASQTYGLIFSRPQIDELLQEL